MSNIPDKLYDRSRDELLPYEDSEFAQLIANVPNFYISQTDQTIWGSLLRDVAAELGRLEYFHSYDMVGKDPSYLTPADAKRQWNDPLFINRNYPPADKYDLDYKSLVIALIKAFQMGATVASIEAVIKAYTGQDIQIEELWKQIGQGRFDATSRNTLRVAARVAGVGSDSMIHLSTSEDVIAASVNVNALKTLTDDLYGAIDAAKPAHVGIDLITVFGVDEIPSIGDHIYGTVGIVDELRIIAKMIESEPLDPPLYQAPFLDPKHPDTGLASTDVDNWIHNVFTPDPTNPPPAPAAGTTLGYTLEEFAAYSESATKGVVSSVGTEPPHPGVLSPILNRTWELKSEELEIMDMD